MTYYLYYYKKGHENSIQEDYYLLSTSIVKGVDFSEPTKTIFYNEYYQETYNLIATITQEEITTQELTVLANQFNKKILYNDTIYYPKSYQTKMGREVSAHCINNNTNRISSRIPSLNKIEDDIKRDKAVVKVHYHYLKDDINGESSGGSSEQDRLEEQLYAKVKASIEEDIDNILTVLRAGFKNYTLIDYKRLVLKAIAIVSCKEKAVIYKNPIYNSNNLSFKIVVVTCKNGIVSLKTFESGEDLINLVEMVPTKLKFNNYVKLVEQLVNRSLRR